VSREAAFLVNNWILLFAALFVLFATMFPTLSEAITGERLTVGPPFFNKWMLPIGLILLFLTGYGPLTAWRKSTLLNLRDQFLWPVAAGLVVGITIVALGVRVWASGLCFAFSAFVAGTIGQEFWRGARVRQGATGTDILTALIGLVARNKRRYGGYIIHVGHRPHLPWLCRKRLQSERRGHAQAGPADDRRRLYGAAQWSEGHRRRARSR
jgi:cytochrome c-type biogenesis protein CcmF